MAVETQWQNETSLDNYKTRRPQLASGLDKRTMLQILDQGRWSLAESLISFDTSACQWTNGNHAARHGQYSPRLNHGPSHQSLEHLQDLLQQLWPSGEVLTGISALDLSIPSLTVDFSPMISTTGWKETVPRPLASVYRGKSQTE